MLEVRPMQHFIHCQRAFISSQRFLGHMCLFIYPICFSLFVCYELYELCALRELPSCIGDVVVIVVVTL